MDQIPNVFIGNPRCGKCLSLHPITFDCQADKPSLMPPAATKVVTDSPFIRGAEGVKCDCGGFAEKVDTTDEEDAQLGCGRPNCCSAAFVCCLCKTRIVGRVEAPEYRD